MKQKQLFARGLREWETGHCARIIAFIRDATTFNYVLKYANGMRAASSDTWKTLLWKTPTSVAQDRFEHPLKAYCLLLLSYEQLTTRACTVELPAFCRQTLSPLVNED